MLRSHMDAFDEFGYCLKAMHSGLEASAHCSVPLGLFAMAGQLNEWGFFHWAKAHAISNITVQ